MKSDLQAKVVELKNAHHIPRLWKDAPRRWGHPLHSLCSYFAMFPPQIPRVFVEWLTRPGDVVYDPFSGRGTTPLEACRLGRIGFGSDANPLAHLLTLAKVNPPSLVEVHERLNDLQGTMPTKRCCQVPDDIRMLYSRKVLRQLCWLRRQLDRESQTDCFVMALLMGVMHANYRPGYRIRGLSVSMPNTFSMSPGYVRRFIEEHDLRPPPADTFEILRAKAARMSLPTEGACRGRAWMADARSASHLQDFSAKLIFTSPPYLSVIKYGKYNWIRLWMLGYEPNEVDQRLTATSSLNRYVSFMTDVLSELLQVTSEEGYACLMIGDVADRSSGETLNLAEEIWSRVAEPAGWRQLGMVADRLPEKHKVTRIWGSSKRGRATVTDRILILAPPKTHHRLPQLPRAFRWDKQVNWASTTAN